MLCTFRLYSTNQISQSPKGTNRNPRPHHGPGAFRDPPRDAHTCRDLLQLILPRYFEVVVLPDPYFCGFAFPSFLVRKAKSRTNALILSCIIKADSPNKHGTQPILLCTNITFVSTQNCKSSTILSTFLLTQEIKFTRPKQSTFCQDISPFSMSILVLINVLSCKHTIARKRHAHPRADKWQS